MQPHQNPTTSRYRRLQRAVAAGATATCVAAAVFVPAPAHAARAGGAAVLVVGDSLTIGAADYGGLRGKLQEHGFAPTISARSGRGVEGGLSVLRSTGSLPNTVVVALGTNDVAFGRSAKSFAGLVDSVMDTVGDDRLVLWVNLDLDATTWAELAARFNRVLVDKAGQYANLAVADWRSFATDDWLASDDVHLNGKGYRQRANFYVWQLQAWT